MIRDTNVKVTYRDAHGHTSDLTMTVSGKQITQTIQRRMASLMPNVTVIDMTEVVPDSVQLDATAKPRNPTK